MSNLNEKIAYLKGLAHGLAFEEDSREGKMMLAIIDVLSEMEVSLQELQAENDENVECVFELESRLDEIEALCEVDSCDCDDECCDDDEFDDEVDFMDINDDFISFQCPNCGEIVYFDQAMLKTEDDLICPNCKASMLEDEEDEDDDDDL